MARWWLFLGQWHKWQLAIEMIIKKRAIHPSALLVVVAQLLEAARDGFTHTETTEEPVI